MKTIRQSKGSFCEKLLAEHIRFAKKTGQVESWLKERFIEVGEIVKQYVPEGCSFDYAEEVLQSAGFTLERRPTPGSPSRFGGEYASDVNAYLGYGPKPFFEGVQCVVALRPAEPYEYGLVHRVLTTCGAAVSGDFRDARTGQIDDVSDTAFMVATYRAIETSRSEALFRDPLAAKLAGRYGEAIVKGRPKWSLIGQWLVAMRTRIIDEFIENAIAQGITTILNLGAGLDTRPYRMDLPEQIRWIEIDAPKIVWLKERVLSSEKPRCNLERIKLDLTDVPARRRLFAEITKSGKTLVLTEGVIPYLSTKDVASLADDLREHAAFQCWIVDYSSPETTRYRRKVARRMRMHNAPFLFEPKDYFGFFREHGWHAKDIRYLPEEAQKLNRPFPLPRLWRWQLMIRNFITGGRSQRAFQKSTAFVLLQPSPVDELAESPPSI